MRQLLQINRTGELLVEEIPRPKPQQNQLLVRTVASLVSVGTEKHMLEFAQKSLLGKALERPDLVRQVIAKARAEGVAEAWRQSMARLDIPAPVGYASAGVVIGVGSGVENFREGDRVACSGAGFAAHAEISAVPKNLCARIPPGVEFESAAFAAVGGIALEAVRMSGVTLGADVAVIGLGLLGQITVQLLRAAGCHVVGMDLNSQKTQMVLDAGAEAVANSYQGLRALVPRARAHRGFDVAIILAATPSNEPLAEAAEICRERGRVVATGLVGLEVPRKLFYDKELELVVSRAWGPGLYDAEYTDAGLDYPLPFARWTAQRNLQEFLAQMSKGAIRVDQLISHRFDFSNCREAYDLILSGKEPTMGVMLNYPRIDPAVLEGDALWPQKSNSLGQKTRRGTLGIGLIGAGLFARGTLLPILDKTAGVRLRGVASSAGLNASHVARKFGFEYCTAESAKILEDPDIDLVFVLTRHGSHGELVSECLRRGKHVFVEKPLAILPQQLEEIVVTCAAIGDSRAAPSSIVMVGFNRRFSKFTRWIKQQFVAIKESVVVQCTVNAGVLAPDSWVYDSADGGGRIIGEVCHFIDLLQYLTGSLPQSIYAQALRSDRYHHSDNVMISLKMVNGAVCSIQYVSGGDKGYPREQVEIFGGGIAGRIDDFRSAYVVRQGRRKRLRNLFTVDRGHRSEIDLLLDAIRRGAPAPVGLNEYIATTLATFAIEDSLRLGRPVEINPTLAHSGRLFSREIPSVVSPVAI